ncbi:MAG: (d)CMP kinase [Prevotella sp.]|nr:(d)CMP kinase [Prevotella sp.]
MKKITIAVDGYSSCGKSTMAKHLAATLGYIYVDTGAMYRAVTLYALENKLFRCNKPDAQAVENALANIQIGFTREAGTGKLRTMLNGRDVEDAIRAMDVSQNVSAIAALPEVRRAMVRQQRAMGKDKGVVMDGRDIGTTVFPDAELKIFVTADANVRAQRRYDELAGKGVRADFNEILENVKSRDYTDSHRAASPLTQAPDAVLLDNSRMSIEEQDQWVLQLARKAIEKANACG